MARVYDTAAAKDSVRSFDHGGHVSSVAFSPDGTLALTVGQDEFAQVWDARTWQKRTRLRVPGRKFGRFSPDNRLVACWDESPFQQKGSLAWWEVDSGRLVREVPDVDDDLQGFDWRPDGQQVLRASARGEVTLWNAASDWKMSLALPHFGLAAVYSPDSRLLLTTGADSVVRIWDLCDRVEPRAWQGPDRDEFNTALPLETYYTRGGHFPVLKHASEVKTVSGSRNVAWPDLPRLERLLPPGVSFNSGALSPDQSRVITCHDSPGEQRGLGHKVLQLWGAKTGQRVGKPLESQTSYTHAAFSPDSRLLVVTATAPPGAVGTAQLLDTRTGKPIGSPLKHDQSVLYAAFSPDSELLVTCGADGTARLWRTKTDEPVGAKLVHADWVTRAVFSSDAKTVATASLDGTVRLWDVRGTPRGLVDLKNGLAWDLAFDSSGAFLMVAFVSTRSNFGGDEAPVRIRMWDVATQQPVTPALDGSQAMQEPFRFWFREDGRVVFGFATRRVLNLAPDRRPAADLARLAQLYSGRRQDDHGGSTVLRRAEVQALWNDLRARYPEDFSVPAAAALDWRVEQLQARDRAVAELIQRMAVPFNRRINQPETSQTLTFGGPVMQRFHRRWLAAELTESGWQPGEPGHEALARDNYLQRLWALAQYGRPADAVAAADALAVRWPRDPETLYGCTCVDALAAGSVKDPARADRYAASAVARLRQAAQAGNRSADSLLADPDLEAIRHRPDFIPLLWDLAESR